MFCSMASACPSRQRDEESNAFAGIETESNEKCESSNMYDVFINHRGPDVKEQLAIPLYHSLREAQIRAYLDEKENRHGDSISGNIKTAIYSASVHIAILSPKYAESAWCLAELTAMLKTGATIIPVFYDVSPSEVRYLGSSYQDAFTAHVNKNRYPDKLEEWKQSLKIVSGKLGEEVTSNDAVDKLCRKLVSIVKEQLEKVELSTLGFAKAEVEKRNIPLEVARYKVGLDELVKDFEMHCPNRGEVVGILGIGGSGKTTLAKELFNRKCSDYRNSSFLFNVGEACRNGKLTSLQSKLLSDISPACNQKISKKREGILLLKSVLKSLSRFLIVIDDVDDAPQLNALVPFHELNADSLVIATAQDKGVLEEANIRVYYETKKMDSENSKRLFSWHAFQNEPPCGYENLVERFVGKCGGLPLSLRLLGGHAFCTEKDTWQLELGRIPEASDIQSILELSYDALKDNEKDIFVDIACFFSDAEMEMGKRIWKASGWEIEDALKTLRDRGLVDVVQQDFDKGTPTYVFRMHEELCTFGKKTAESTKIKRVWRLEDKVLNSHNFQAILTKAQNDNFRCLNSITHMDITYFLGHSEKSVTLQWLELDSEYIPEWIPLNCLEALRVISGVPNKLWRSDDQAPRVLKELLCKFTQLDSMEKRVILDNWSKYSMSIGKLSELECLTLNLNSSKARRDLEIKWNSFLETVMRDTHLKTLDLLGFDVKGDIDLSNDRKMTRSLESLTLSEVTCRDTFNVSISGEYCPALKYLKIFKMRDLIELNLKVVKTLKCLEVLECWDLARVLGNDLVELEILCIESCSEVQELPHIVSALKRIRIMACERLQVIGGIEDLRSVEDITITRCPELRTITGLEKFEKLKFMILSGDSMLRCFSKRLPLEFTVVMGRAATPSLNTVQIRNVIERADSHRKFKSREEGYKELRSLQNCEQSFCSIILFVMVDTRGPAYMDRRPHCGKTIQLSWGSEGKMIYTIVVTDPIEISTVSHSIPGYCWMPNFKLQERGKYLRPRGGIKEGHILAMNSGRECETLSILKNLTNQLYNSDVESLQ